MATYHIHIEGYWLDHNKSGLPDYSGIYFVFRCVYNSNANTADIKQLLYIGQTGQSGGIRDRLVNHEKYEEFQNACKENELVCYATSEVPVDDLDIIENALISAEQPPINEELKDHFKYDESTIKTSGYNSGLENKWFVIINDEVATISVVEEDEPK